MTGFAYAWVQCTQENRQVQPVVILINKARMRLDESKQATEEKTRHAMTPLDMSLYDDVMNTSSTFNTPAHRCTNVNQLCGIKCAKNALSLALSRHPLPVQQ